MAIVYLLFFVASLTGLLVSSGSILSSLPQFHWSSFLLTLAFAATELAALTPPAACPTTAPTQTSPTYTAHGYGIHSIHGTDDVRHTNRHRAHAHSSNQPRGVNTKGTRFCPCAAYQRQIDSTKRLSTRPTVNPTSP